MIVKRTQIRQIIREEILKEVTSSEFNKLLESDPEILQQVLPAVKLLMDIQQKHNIDPEDIVSSVQELEKTGLLDALLNKK